MQHVLDIPTDFTHGFSGPTEYTHEFYKQILQMDFIDGIYLQILPTDVTHRFYSQILQIYRKTCNLEQL